MSNRTFFVARKESAEDEEPFDCGLYSLTTGCALTTGWSYAPLRMTSEDRGVFAARLAQGCEDWARAHGEFRPRTADTRPGAAWTATAGVDSTDSAPDEQLAEIDSD
jgi:hypothetical protein